MRQNTHSIPSISVLFFSPATTCYGHRFNLGFSDLPYMRQPLKISQLHQAFTRGPKAPTKVVLKGLQQSRLPTLLLVFGLNLSSWLPDQNIHRDQASPYLEFKVLFKVQVKAHPGKSCSTPARGQNDIHWWRLICMEQKMFPWLTWYNLNTDAHKFNTI